MVTEAEVKAKLTDAFSPVYLEVTDESDGCGAKFNLIIVSEQFEGKALLARQRSVHSALAVEMPSIHAVTMKTLTPAQWQAQQQ
uniref:BolA-like protein 2 n=1 Tax=Plectus sambesii TaxID=2011161 RepID=A0A914X7A2_9BILA